MTASRDTTTADVRNEVLTPEVARAHVASGALRPGPIGTVGLELEAHLVDLRRCDARVGWARAVAAVESLPAMPGGSSVTLEPGGQVELSTPTYGGVAAAVDALRLDRAVLREGLAQRGLGTACLGTDPARVAQRVSPGGRYAGMEAYFTGIGEGATGRAMMCSTAALQVNVDAGPASGWPARVTLASALGPVLVAMSGCSPLLAGRETGWRSTRQQVWGRLDRHRCGPLLGGDVPETEWAAYALCAPVMLVREPGDGSPRAVTGSGGGVPFGAWAAGDVALGGRPPNVEDLDYHLTTLFPPVRLRGFLELRYLDAVPDRWWPALAAIAVALLDDTAAADTARDATEPVARSWTAAAREGLADPELARAARRCMDAAVAAAPPSLEGDVEAYAELIAAGRTPGDDVLDRARRVGALAVLEEEARA